MREGGGGGEGVDSYRYTLEANVIDCTNLHTLLDC